MKLQRQHVLRVVLFAIMTLAPFTFVSAEQFIANITLKQGERKTLRLSSAYKSIMTSYGIGSPSWWSDNTNVCSVSSRTKVSCDIYGASVGLTYVHFKGEYWSGTVISEYECYWTINVESNAGGGGGGGGGTTPSSDDDYTLPEESWGDFGNYDFSWYNKNQTEFTISTNKELAGIAYLVNNGYSNFSGKTIKIAGDISLNGKSWLSIGSTKDYCFKGTVDGQGHIVEGLIIGKQKDNQQYYGFFGYLDGSIIRNVIVRGEVVVVNPTYSGSNSTAHYVGGLAGYSSSSTIENCRCEMPVKYSKNIQIGGWVRSIYVGGLLGAGEKTTIKYCSHEGDVSCIQTPVYAGNYAPGKPYVGGLVGDYSGTVEFCENISSNITCDFPQHSKGAVYNAYVGGLIAECYSGSIKHCRNISSFEVIHHGLSGIGAHKQFYIGGISKSYRATEIDCYSSVSKAIFKYEQVNNNSGACEFHYGGISGNNTGNANFSNSDIEIQTNQTLIREYDGSTQFSSDQMQTPAFLQELNMYSMFEMDGPVWTQDEGDYPYIAKLHETSGISSVFIDKKDDINIYTLSGQRLTSPKKGINIVGGRKVVLK